jgi:GTP-binding protein EngB required for normal cell division
VVKVAEDFSLGAGLVHIASYVEERLPGTVAAGQAATIKQRLSEPLRVAIAGRVKAGKSTLLNALVGERLAPTDAGECTRIVSWYRRGPGYSVRARLKNGATRELAFTRDNGHLDVKLDSLAESDVAALDVQWPTSRLERITLVDTPGLGSLNDENSRRTRDFLEYDSSRASEVDAVIYLMRHAHRTDITYLDAFMDRRVAAASPVNSVAVLSRADEIGAGRLDAMESATRIAARYEADPNLRGLCNAVVPMAGLLAETGLTLREDEVAALRTLASSDPDVLTRMLLSAEEFCDVSVSELTVELRRALLHRLGIFGIRVALLEVGQGNASAATLGPALVARSGLPRLGQMLEQTFLPQAQVLKARSAARALQVLALELAEREPDVATHVRSSVERLETSSTEFARVRALHLVRTASIRLRPQDRERADRLLSRDGATVGNLVALGESGLLSEIAYWRTVAADPIVDPTTVEVCDVVVRLFEAAYALLLTDRVPAAS